MSTALDVSLKVLYVQGSVPAVDAATTEQLRTLAAELQITTIAGSAAALAELRRTPGWQALLASPTLPQNEILALITSLRRDRIPIAIVPVVDESHQDLFASAVASGADDVLVRRGETLVNLQETLARIRQSPHLFPAEQRRRISVLYAGRDPLVWNLLDQVPFVKAERVTCGVDGACSVRRAGAGDDSLRADAVIIDEQPGEAHPLQVLKSVKAQASDLPVIMLTSAGAADIATAALELGADDTVLKTGIFRRRLIATLRRVHQRLELTAQQVETKTREERLRQIVENVPTGIIVIAAGGNVLAMNAAALQLFGATKPRDIVGRDFRQLVGQQDQDAITDLIRNVTRGDAAAASFEALTLEGGRVRAHMQAVVLERDARGGRGVVASVTLAETRATEPDHRADELAGLQDTLQRMERHYAEIADARANEQAAWDNERRRFETRLEEAERLAAERSTLGERLDEVTAELQRTSESFAAERQSLEVRLRELETAAREASSIGATKDELERALNAVREEQQQAIEAHAIERSGWQDIRSELESRVRDLGTTHDTEHASTITTLQGEMRQLEQLLAGERERWDATRQQLETELRNTREALWAEHNERDAARSEAEQELARLRTEHDAQVAAWNTARESLEHAVAEALMAVEATGADRDRIRSDFERDVAQVRASLETVVAETRQSAGEAQVEWDRVRAQFEQELQDARSLLDNERAAWRARQAELEDDLRRAQNAEGAQRELTAVRSRLEAELEEARQQIALERGSAEAIETRAREEIERAQETARAIAEEYDATRVRLEQERHEARQALDVERLTWSDERFRLTSDLAGASNQAQIIQQRWEDERLQHAEERRQALEAAQATWQDHRLRLESDLADARLREDEWVQECARLEDAARAAQQLSDQQRQQYDTRSAEETTIQRLALEALQAERDAAQRERDDAHTRVAAVSAELDEARRQAAERDGLAAALEQAQRERDAAQFEAATVRGERDSAQYNLGNLRYERDEAHNRITALSNELAEVGRRASDRDSLAAALEAARRDTDTARSERDAAQFDVNIARGERDNAQYELNNLRYERDEAHNRITALWNELTEARSRAGDRDSLAAALDAAHNDSNAARAERDAVQFDVNIARGERDSARNERDAAQYEMNNLRYERDEAHNRLTALGGDLDEARRQAGERDALAIALDQAHYDLGAARADRDTAQHELVNVRAERDEAKERVATLAAELDEARRLAGDRDGIAAALDAARNEIRHTDAAHHMEREGWERTRGALEHELRDARNEQDAERETWTRTRVQLEVDAREATRLAEELHRVEQALASVRADYATLSQTLATERTRHEHDRREADALRGAVADAESRQAELDAALVRAARSAETQLARQTSVHDARLRDLEGDLQEANQRLAQVSGAAEATRAELRAGYARAWESHSRLVGTDMFGYAVTTLAGELIRCNDAFARMFGFVNGAEVLARSAGQPFRALSVANRPDVAARLMAAGRIDRIESCVERIDGRAMRLTDSLILTAAESDPDIRLVEHIMTAAPAGPSAEELQGRRMQEVGALTSAMMPELESLITSADERSDDLRRLAGGTGVQAADIEGLRAVETRIGLLVRQLAGFTRRQVRGEEPVDLREAIVRAEPMLSRLAGDYVTLSTDLTATTPIATRTGDLDQLLTSLVTLGRDLLPTGGSITIHSYQNHDSSSSDSGDSFHVPGPILSVRGSGYGARMPGSVSALELVAERCGGRVRAQGEDGRTVRLDVLFPRCK